ncbi:hypothetical protein CMI37_18880 [Candidatus Pacearchaeota archaeon]|nr:hypothetical protein [Candidatus Pacearchaeota archaeon]|tara:strand:+ start:1361 stop:1720 length:360 start_codon:yes stop_codon:yes gene_type:complete
MSYNPHDYPVPQQRIPGYLPYPRPIGPTGGPVPNEAFGFWPQGQFAPEFLPPGSASFQPYRYPRHQGDRPLAGLEYAEDNPVYIDTSQLLWLGAAAALGYFAAKKGWDLRLRALVKSKL